MRKQILKGLGIASLGLLSLGLASCGGDDAPSSVDVAEAKAKVEALASGSGYEFSYKATYPTGTTNVTFGQKDGFNWMISDNMGMAYEVRNKTDYLFYEYDGSWSFQAAYTGSTASSMVGTVDAIRNAFYSYSEYDVFDYASSDTVAGRSAYKYTVTGKVGGEEVTGSVWIDKEYLITLKAESSYDGETGGMECTSFKVNPSLPNFNAPEEYEVTSFEF